MGYTYSAIPMVLGISYHSMWKFFETYLGGGIGLTLTSNNFPNFNGNRNFCYSGVAGIKYKIKGIDLVVIDMNIRYWAIATDKLSTYWLGFNTGVTFNL
ncbi:MAG: hypothetical protein CO128_08385 [Ignavibacteriales bacterium CG_4_9_14_3_um_filter_30_11]|nr:MAG: hypothetical protein CO128_08385 [Ignavibacteriales bacterium CG_4_9_14_3_um_filter_30_11]